MQPRARSVVAATLRNRFPEMWRFATVGVAATAIEFTLFNFFVFALVMGPVTAKVLATTAAMGTAYLGNLHWSFRGRPRGSQTSQAGRFVAVNIAGIALGAGLMAVARFGLGADSFIALNLMNLGTVLTVMVLRFWAYHAWVFPDERPSEHPAGRSAGTPGLPATVRKRTVVLQGAAQ